MASSEYIDRLVNIIAYEFRDRSLPVRALTAPGAEGDKEGTEEEQVKYQGNRLLAQVGKSLLQLIVETRALSKGGSKRGDIRKALEPATAGQNHIKRAKALEVDVNTKLNPRQKNVAEPRTLQLTIYAIVGAVWQDCNEDFSIINNVVERLFIGVETGDCVNPQDISLDELVFVELFNDNTIERSQLAQSTRTSHFATDVDLIQHVSSRGLDLHNHNKTAPPCNDQASSINVGDGRDQEQHNPARFDNEPAVLPLHGNVPPGNQSQGRALSLHFDHRPPIGTVVRSKRSSRQVEKDSSSNNVERQPVQGSIASGPVTKKPRCSTSNLESRQSTHLFDYLILEERRCRSLGLPFPWTDIDSAIRASNTSLTNSDLATLKTIFFVVGSPESLVALREVLKAQRSSNRDDEEHGRRFDLPPADRVRAIEGMGPNIACLVLRRRCHIYQLFLDYSQGSRRTSDGFVVDTTHSISSRRGPQIGNPNNLEDSRIVEEILKDVYPDLNPGADTYQKKRRFVKNLRKLGKRFDMLVKAFGYGILGLLSWPRGDLLEVPVLAITDELILSLSDAVFKSFILYLAKVQGDHLCATSSAVSDAVTALFHASLPSTSFALEQVESSEILGFSKGSLVLLHLIS